MSKNFEPRPRAVVILQDGTLFWGRATGLDGTATGEICFNTGMTGYQEIFTDPSYFGQIMVTATAHIGNYGVKDDEVESDGIKIAGLICKNFSQKHSRASANSSLASYFQQHNKVLISDVDTRALVRHIRTRGAMNAIISTEVENIAALRKKLDQVPSMEGLELASQVTTAESFTFGASRAKHRLAVLDLGVKRNILRHFARRDCFLKVFPMDTPAQEMLDWEPDGLFISNGPGDPAAMTQTLQVVNDMVASGKPVFGICLGHQLIALARGLSTFKMHQGHRGINHPVLNLQTGRGEITTQNHGFAVSAEALESSEELEWTHKHLNDQGVQGLRLKDKPVSSVQYHPEAFPGPHDSHYLFDEFVAQMAKA
jgi:carbamoyl-phosphate synthase small subunit